MGTEKIIGIDLGTSNSQAAVMMGGKPTIIPSAEGVTIAGKMFPSVVAFTENNQLLVGEPAKRQAVSNPSRTVMAIKRKMGTDYKIKINNVSYTPQQISAFILQKIKRDSEAFLGEPVKKAVITVPAYFNDNQRQATKDAGKIAGLEVVRMINEPTAASLAYGLDKGKEQRIMIFDLGGGTLDVTIMEMGDGVFEVKSTSGDTQLGGTDMDGIILKYIIEEFRRTDSVDLNKDDKAIQRVREAAEKAKIELSTVNETEINLPYITADQSGPKHLVLKITRAKLESLISEIVERCRKPVEQALSDAKLSKDDISKVILVGGPTRMPVIVDFVEKIMGPKVEKSVDPMECVALGAAIQGGVLAGDVKDLLLLDVTPLTLGIETLGGVCTSLISKNTTIPVKKTKVFSTAADMQTAVTIHVLQGERPMAGDNTSLGSFNLEGIPPAPRGVPQIEVTFDIDASGIMHVSAKDKGTGKEQKITITASTKLSDSDVDNMVNEAKKHEEEDKRKKEEIETKNEAESLIYTLEKTLSEHKDKISEASKKELEEKMKELKSALDSNNLQEIKKKKDELTEIAQKIGTEIYKSQAETQKQESEEKKEEPKKPDDNVYDADFKVDK